MKPVITIVYCPKCHWLLRAAYMAQEFLTTFENELKGVTLQPSEVSGDFHISIDGRKIFDRKEYGGFPEIKELKQQNEKLNNVILELKGETINNINSHNAITNNNSAHLNLLKINIRVLTFTLPVSLKKKDIKKLLICIIIVA